MKQNKNCHFIEWQLDNHGILHFRYFRFTTLRIYLSIDLPFHTTRLLKLTNPYYSIVFDNDYHYHEVFRNNVILLIYAFPICGGTPKTFSIAIEKRPIHPSCKYNLQNQ